MGPYLPECPGWRGVADVLRKGPGETFQGIPAAAAVQAVRTQTGELQCLRKNPHCEDRVRVLHGEEEVPPQGRGDP